MQAYLKTALALALGLAWLAPLHADDNKVDPAVFADKSALADDLDALYAELKVRHPDLYRLHSKSDWDAQYRSLKSAIPDLDWPHFVVALHRFVAMAGDGHTNLFSKRLIGPGFDVRYAVRFGLFSDGLYVISGTDEIKPGIGGRVIAVNGHSIGEVERAETRLTGHDSPMWAAAWIPVLLLYPGNLAGLNFGSSDSRLNLTLAMPYGKVLNVTVAFEPIDKQSTQLTVFDVLNNGGRFPSWWSQVEPLTFQYWESTQTVYAIFAHVRDGQKETLKQIADRMFAFIAANNVRRLIIDVRKNGGGNNHLLSPLIDGARTSKLNRPGGLYVIIGRQTFSAAQNFVNRMENSTQALFAGEPTGESPNQVYQAELHYLPHTTLPVLISSRRWRDSAADDDRIWTMPDIPARFSFDDFVNGRDPAIDAVLALDVDNLEPAADLSKRWMRPNQRAAWTLPVPVE